VDVVSKVLAVTASGSVTAVIGRPGAGVSSALAAACDAAVTVGVDAVLASWERPPSRSAELLNDTTVATPEIINWDLDELRRCRELLNAAEGTVVAVDYLQLIDHNTDQLGTVAELRALAVEKQWRVVLGVMLPRQATQLGPLVDHVDHALLL
jgi:hypothetical protein